MNIYYVYKHVHPITHELVYVGKGCKARAWITEGGGRDHNKEHLKWLADLTSEGFLPTDWVHIVWKGLSNKEAMAREHAMIDDINPPFNLSNKSKACSLSKKKREIILELRSHGWSYNQIAKNVNTSIMTVSRFLNNKTKGYLNGV